MAPLSANFQQQNNQLHRQWAFINTANSLHLDIEFPVSSGIAYTAVAHNKAQVYVCQTMKSCALVVLHQSGAATITNHFKRESTRISKPEDIRKKIQEIADASIERMKETLGQHPPVDLPLRQKLG